MSGDVNDVVSATQNKEGTIGITNAPIKMLYINLPGTLDQ
ncbi:MAG: hypothetical protein ACJA2P_002027 [Rhodoferax sp.]